MNYILKKVIVLFIFIELVHNLHAQEELNKTHRKIQIIPGVHQLFSTHNTYFKGWGFVISFPVSDYVFLGLGAEYSSTHYHFDNDWDLSRLKFLPVFIDTRILLYKDNKVTPYIRVATGISFNRYIKKEVYLQREPYLVKEKGLYLLSTIGCSFHLTKYFSPVIEAGFKGFRMSFNQYDVNPHGLVLNAGIIFNI
jgi:hypothetical protein